jgi:DNA (cytosine-5)-methyltransferase 1
LSAYYNEYDPAAAYVLTDLSRQNLIAPGRIDSRSIKEVQPHDLDAFSQHHFFAGAGLWSVATRLAGWPDDLGLWTASLPCQPFSVAGKGAGFDDERHLWPDFFRLVRAWRPPRIVGEQVAGTAGEDWFNGVRADLAREGYEARMVVLPSLAVDAPNVRLRQYWVAVADAESSERGTGLRKDRAVSDGPVAANSDGGHQLLADAIGSECHGRPVEPQRRPEGGTALGRHDANGVTLGNAFGTGLEGHAGHDGGASGRQEPDRSASAAEGGYVADAAGDGRQQGIGAAAAARYGRVAAAANSAANGSFWSDHEWIVCHDGKARRTKPGLRLLVDGMAGRIHLWRLAGNSINAVLAAEVLAALLETEVRPGQ